jgi:predicted acyl esterase
VVVTTNGNNNPNGVASDKVQAIPGSDGTPLAAEVMIPKGTGPFPLVVMPGSWGKNETEYHYPGLTFASAGYVVVGYAQRGFLNSGGRIDLAGDPTRADARAVIDWAIAHAHADQNRIGMLGTSYGGGVSLLTAAADPRVKAVVAMSGWADLAAALAPNGTPNVLGMNLLFSRVVNALSPDVQALAAGLGGASSATIGRLEALSKSRSVVTAALNRNRPAIMLANAYEDSAIDPQQIVRLYNRLTTPKRIELAPGDHAGPELSALFGQPNQTFTDAKKWLDHYLLGKANGIDGADPIQLLDGATGKVHGYRAWPKAQTLALGTPGPRGAIGAAASSWNKQLAAGANSGADSGPVQNPQQAYRSPTIPSASISAQRALAWKGAALTKATVISGTPTLRINLAKSSGPSTFFTYLYDVDAAGKATLITYSPETTSGGKVSVPLRPTSWTVASGHHVSLVIDTVDQRFRSATAPGTTLAFSSTKAAPATLSLPTG